MTATEAKENPKKESRGRLWAFRGLALLFGVSLSLLVLEFAVRVFAPQALVSDIVAGDEDIDYRLRPNARGRMTSPEYSAEIRINSLGFRGEEVSVVKTPNVTRVLFLGDSSTFGHGVGENETLPYLVGQRLQQTHPHRFEVINGGVYGYCTANELDFFVKFGLPLKPDIVVILVMVHDMFDNPSWYDLRDDGTLRKRTIASQYVLSRRVTRYIPGAPWLREHSHLFKFVGVRVFPVLTSGLGLTPGDATPEDKPETRIDEHTPEFYRQKGGPFAVTTALLDKLAEVAAKNGSKVILLTLGSRGELRRRSRPFSEVMLPHQQLIDAGSRAGFADGLALLPILATAPAREALFFPQDGHWTATATRLVTPAVADVISRVADRRQHSRERR